MAVRFVLDENVRGPLWDAIQAHNARGIDLIDAVRVGDPNDLPLRTPDPAILIWAEREARVLVTDDRKSMPRHLLDHLRFGQHSPGIFIIRSQSTIPQLISFLATVAQSSDASEWADLITFIP
jgi:hypothetical protein